MYHPTLPAPADTQTYTVPENTDVFQYSTKSKFIVEALTFNLLKSSEDNSSGNNDWLQLNIRNARPIPAVLIALLVVASGGIYFQVLNFK